MGSMPYEHHDSDLLNATRLMEGMSLGGRVGLENQQDVLRSSDLIQSVPDDVLAEIFQAGLCQQEMA